MSASQNQSQNKNTKVGQYPRVSGQFAEYVEAQLKAFRAGTRSNDPNGMMRGVAARMTDREMQAVAEYVAGLR